MPLAKSSFSTMVEMIKDLETSHMILFFTTSRLGNKRFGLVLVSVVSNEAFL